MILASEVKKLDEILMWLRFMNVQKVYKVLENHLNTDEKIVAYHKSDGETTTRDISKFITPTHSTIAEWWKEWYKLGIVEAIGVQRGKRAKKLFDLEDYGIDIPLEPAQPDTNEKNEA